MKRLIALVAAAFFCAAAFAQNGGIDSLMLHTIRQGYANTAADKAVRNALNAASLNTLAVNAENMAMIDTDFSDRVMTFGITDQKQSGRCWLFTGLNVLRAALIDKNNLTGFKFSQSYCFFYDQLEKANMFMQAIIDTKDLPVDDRQVDWLLSNPIGDGGTFTGVANLVMKYGAVPDDVMPESLIANSTAQFNAQLKTILRQDALKLREAKCAKCAQKMKVQMLSEIYRILCLAYGEPPQEFEWKGKTYTPVQFYQEMVGFDLNHDYVMLMNDPSREYGKLYEIEYDRHLYDGDNWLYLNLPIDRIKEMAIASIKDNNAMYFSCDVGKFLDRKKGVADLANFDYESLLGVQFTMDKKQRILTHASGSSHAMTLIAVDLKDGKPVKWMVENSWGESSGYHGQIIMTDEWFDEYMFRLVVERKYLPEDLIGYLDQEPVKLPAWDPMFLMEE